MDGKAMTVIEACRLLGLRAPVGADGLSAAFRRAAKAAHPDSAGGDVERFRAVIDAYHLLQAQPAPLPVPVTPRPAEKAFSPPPLLVITPMQALHGGCVSLKLSGRRLLVHIPPGIRTADRVRLDDGQQVPVMIRPADDMSVLDGDLFVTHRIAHRYLRDGGRIEIDTHAGPQVAWLVPDMVEPVRLCFKGLGLPARGTRPAGDLFVKLEGCEDMPSAVEDMLARFTRVWTDHSAAA